MAERGGGEVGGGGAGSSHAAAVAAIDEPRPRPREFFARTQQAGQGRADGEREGGLLGHPVLPSDRRPSL